MTSPIYRLQQTDRDARDFDDRQKALDAWRLAMTQIEDGERTSVYVVRQDTDHEELLGYYQPVPKDTFRLGRIA